MPRIRTVPKVNWKIYLPVDLAGKVDLLTLDPLTGKPRFGARSEYVERLVRQDLARGPESLAAKLDILGDGM